MEDRTDTNDSRLSSGHRIGQYEVISLLGAGGMGEVYRAHDHRLGRDVALKVLPARYDDDPSRAKRFAREARTTGSVNHPNIVSVFDAGEVDDRAYLVTELLSGETLRAYLANRGPLELRDALAIATQIARGLAAAHDRGVVHRDLKPSNIFVTGDGHVKILDFGLARLLLPDLGETDADGETISMVSHPGTILGSVGYMSPEQIESRPADRRSDIFSFGVILYEMLAGRRAFNGASTVATLSAILKDEPANLAGIRPGLPLALAMIVHRCLEKRPDDRLQSTRDLVFNLEQLAESSTSSLGSVAGAAFRAAGRYVRRRRTVSAAAIATLAALALVLLWNVRTTTEARRMDDPRPTRVSSLDIERLTPSANAGFCVALSHDGTWLASDRRDGLWLTHLPTRSETLLRKVECCDFPMCRFSPDGNYLYFVEREMTTSHASLHRTPILGGESLLVSSDVGTPFGEYVLTFDPRGGRLAVNRQGEDGASIVVVASDGSSETVLARRDAPARFLDCSWAPDGMRLLCAAFLGFESHAMLEIDAVSGEQKPIPDIEPLRGFEWIADGSAIVGLTGPYQHQQIVRVSLPDRSSNNVTSDLASYFRISASNDGRVMAAVRIDTTTNLWSVAPEGERHLTQLTTGVNTDDGNFGVAAMPDGRIVWASGGSGRSVDLVVANADGSQRRRLTQDDDSDEIWPDVSRDGRFIAYARRARDRSGGSDIWMLGADGTQPVRLTIAGSDSAPSFSADGRWLYFIRYSGDRTFTWRVPAEGGEAEQAFEDPVIGPKPSPDGRWILVRRGRVAELRPTSGSEPRRLEDVGSARWRPDGSAIAYLRATEGGLNLWIRELDAETPRQLTHFPPGDVVAWGFDWARDGKSIVFARRSETRDVVLLRETK